MRLSLVSVSLLLVSCTADAWVTHPMPRPPDRACRTGGGAGHDVWIWDCVAGEHVVISQYCGGFVGCREAERETVACGRKTPLERQLEPYLGADCREPPLSQRWR